MGRLRALLADFTLLDSLLCGQLVKYFHGKAVFFLLAVCSVLPRSSLVAVAAVQAHDSDSLGLVCSLLGNNDCPLCRALPDCPESYLRSRLRWRGCPACCRITDAATPFPYYLRTYMGHAITPMPGALILSLPFLLMGRVSLQGPVWLAVFIFFA